MEQPDRIAALPVMTPMMYRRLRALVLGAVLLAAAGSVLHAQAGDSARPGGSAADSGSAAVERGIENAAAFARLFGYVRFFHPAQQAVSINWDSLAVEGMRRVEQAPTADSLARTLRGIFARVAPAVQIFPAARPESPRRAAVPRGRGGPPGVAYWRHEGVRTWPAEAPWQEIYRSGIAVAPAPGGRVPEGVPDPRAPLRADLGAGVAAWVPLARFVAPPVDSATWSPVVVPFDTTFSGDERAVRLAAVAIVWNVLQHFYPYFDVVRVDWAAALPAALRAAAADRTAVDFEKTLRGLLALASDGHGWADLVPYRPHAAVPLRTDWIEDRLVVTAIDDSIGDRVRPGDLVLAIDGRPPEQVFAELKPFLPGSPQYARFRGSLLLGGSPGSTVRIRLQDPLQPGAPVREVELVRGRRGYPLERRPAPVEEIEPGVLYFDLTRATDDVFLEARERLAAARGIIFDLRGYPRLHTFAVLAHLTDRPLSPNAARGPAGTPLVLRPDRAGMTYIAGVPGDDVIEPATPRFTSNVVFLTNERAISYSETTLSLVEGFGLGEIAGSATAGANGTNNPFMVPGGYRITWTGGRYRKPDGTLLHIAGIAPTIPVVPTIRGVAEGRDEVLDRALGEVLRRMEEVAAADSGDAGAQPPGHPPTRRDTTVAVLHGERIPDPYRWLEQLDAPEVRAWVAAQNRFTQSLLREHPARARIAARLHELSSRERVGVPWVIGGRLFYTASDALRAQPVLYAAADGSDARQVVLDPNALWPDGSVGVGGYAISPRGRWLAYSASRGGADYGSTHVRDIATGVETADTVRGIWGSPCWTEDERGFFYIGSPAPRPGEAAAAARITKQLRYHRLGTPESADPLLAEWTENYRWAWCMPSDDARRMVVVAERGPDAEVYVMDLGDGRAPDLSATLTRVLPRHPTVWPFALIGTTLYARTYHDAPRGRIVTFDVAGPDTTPRTLVPELDAVISRASVVGDVLVLSTLSNVTSRLQLFTLDGAPAGAVPLPGVGSVGWLRAAPGTPELYFEFSSFGVPTTVYRYDARTRRLEPFRASSLSWDAGRFETRQVFFTSRDGTRVPMFIVARRDTPLDGNNPVLLTGYGGYGFSYLPSFSADAALWLELGGVYAVANIRGGGEYGIEWHRAGSRERKQNSYDDFAAAAEHLIEAGWTSPARLAIEGYSNGGLLVGVMVTQRPDLFAAAVGGAGHYDMLRYHLFTVGAGWIPEFGSPEEPSEFQVLRAYSPLHNVTHGRCFPATLLLTGENDDRVVPSHSYKFAAALQRAQSCARPILLRVAPAVSHGYASREQQLAETTDKMLFLVRQLGMQLP